MWEQGDGAARGPAALKGTHVAAAAWRAMRARPRPLVVIGAAYAAFAVASQWAARALAVTEGLPAVTPRFVAYSLVGGALGALFAALTLRTLLQPGRPAWRPDAGLFAYVVLLTVAGAGLNLLVLGYGNPPPADAADPAAAAAFLGRAILVMGLYLVAAWACLRLMPWPISLLLGEGTVPPGRAFRLMRGAVWPYIFGAAILGVGPVVVWSVVASQYTSQGGEWRLVIGAPFLVFFAMACAAVGAEVYRRRVATAPGGVADTFD